MIKYMEGNLFESPAMIRCHQVNCKGVMGAGIAVEAKKRYPGMFQEYQNRCKAFGRDCLGDVQFYVAEDGTVLANMFSQNAYGKGIQTEYDAFEQCLQIIYEFAEHYHLSVGFPELIGCGLAGGDWNVVKGLIESYFGEDYTPDCYVVKFKEVKKSRPSTSRPVKAAPSATRGRSSQVVTIYTDGACSGNPGPGGWGAVMMMDTASGLYKKELSGSSPQTTNNIMELTGPIEALKLLKKPCKVELYSDSQYLCKAFNDNWIVGWMKNGWKNSKNQAVKNKELWEELLKLTDIHDVTFHWVKGHAANEYNNRCDELAVQAYQKYL